LKIVIYHRHIEIFFLKTRIFNGYGYIHFGLVTPTTIVSFIFLKAIWAGVIAAVVSPVLTVIGMLRASIDIYEADS
jgi:hypothetical protein